MSAARASEQHPIRSAELHVFQGLGAASGRYVARFHPYDTYPVLFTGPSAEAVEAKAEAFRSDAIARHEAAFTARAQARQSRLAKKEATNG
ncbi:hypothetical protein [Paracoccus sp. 22332]|uniref:hypothetical protein n=1 Tax=Paracoccus sp. 22332 TaxID=3453913 RepID=UPI003F875AEC